MAKQINKIKSEKELMDEAQKLAQQRIEKFARAVEQLEREFNCRVSCRVIFMENGPPQFERIFMLNQNQG